MDAVGEVDRGASPCAVQSQARAAAGLSNDSGRLHNASTGGWMRWVRWMRRWILRQGRAAHNWRATPKRWWSQSAETGLVGVRIHGRGSPWLRACRKHGAARNACWVSSGSLIHPSIHSLVPSATDASCPSPVSPSLLYLLRSPAHLIPAAASSAARHSSPFLVTSPRILILLPPQKASALSGPALPVRRLPSCT